MRLPAAECAASEASLAPLSPPRPSELHGVLPQGREVVAGFRPSIRDAATKVLPAPSGMGMVGRALPPRPVDEETRRGRMHPRPNS
jgi:hypothetical protein